MKKNLIALGLALLSLAGQGKSNELRVLQFNIWQEGTVVPDGFQGVVDVIAQTDADFVALSEVRNYHGTRFCDRIVQALAQKGCTYYSFYSDDTGLLSKYPIEKSEVIFPLRNDHGTIHKLTARLPDGRTACVYTAHLDYLNCAYYRIRGYSGSTWKELPGGPDLDLVSILADNITSQRDDAIRAFLADARKEVAQGNLVFIGGDFNEPSHRDWTPATGALADHHGLVVPWTVTTLLEEAGFVDAYRAKYPYPVTHPGYTFPADNPRMPVEKLTWAPKSDERERIDFVFYHPVRGLRLKDAVVVGPRGSIVRSQRVQEQGRDPFFPFPSTESPVWPSDHKGLLVTFQLKAPTVH